MPSKNIGSGIDGIKDRALSFESLEHQLFFGKTLAEITNTFINTPSINLDQAIMKALQLCGELFNVERSYIFQFSEDGSRKSNTHEWCAEGIESQKDQMQDVKREDFSWETARLQKDGYLYIPDLFLLPKEAEFEKKYFLENGLSSLILIALVVEGNMTGFFGFDLPDGKRDWSDDQTALLKVVTGIIAGAIAKARAELELHRNEEMFRSISENTFDMITLLDLDGRYIYCNNSYHRMLGYDPSEMIGKSAFDIVHPSEKNKIMQLFLEGIDNRQSDTTLLIRLLCKDASVKWVEHRVRLLFSDDGEPDKVLIIAQDKTESKVSEEQLLIQRNLSFKLAATSNLTEALEYCLEAAIKISGMDSGGIYLVDPENGGLDLVCHKGLSQDFYSAAQHYEPGSPNALMIKEGKAFYICSHETSVRDEAVQREGLTSLAVLPIKAGDRIVACLNVASHSSSDIPANARNALETIVSLITSSLARIKAEEALKESNDRYRLLVSNVPGIIFSCAQDQDWTMSYMSNDVEALTGYKAADFIDNNIRTYNSIIHPDDRKKTYKAITGHNSREQPYHIRYRIITADGSIRWVRESGRTIYKKDGAVSHIDGVIMDITDLKSYEEQLKYLSLHDQLTGLYNRVYFEAELDRLEKSREYPISIISVDLDGLKLINDTMGHDAGDRLLKTCANLLQLSIRGSDILARIGGDEFSAILPGTDNETGEKIARRIRASITSNNNENPELPMSLSLGVATTGDKEITLKELFKEADDAMYRDKLYSNVSARNRVVNCLMTALSKRDFITEGHALRLEELCLAIGEKEGLSSRQLTDLALLAQVHDLGKVGIPDNILFKSGPLDHKEWEVMKQHAEKGYRIALASPDLAVVADLILKHHERWDGSGYPLGLKENEIPVECRILAIVDAFDAMTNDRPYSSAISIEAAKTEIISCSGSHFDPHLVELFIPLLSVPS